VKRSSAAAQRRHANSRVSQWPAQIEKSTQAGLEASRITPKTWYQSGQAAAAAVAAERGGGGEGGEGAEAILTLELAGMPAGPDVISCSRGIAHSYASELEFHRSFQKLAHVWPTYYLDYKRGRELKTIPLMSTSHLLIFLAPHA